MIVLIGYI